MDKTQDFFTSLHNLVNYINTPLWNMLVWLLLGTGIFFSVKTKFAQFQLFKQSVKAMGTSRKDPNDPHGISSFQAFATGLAARVGTGNIAGVAIAISIGGAGAVFWMWLVALIGMSSAFAESSLAQLFKFRDHDNGHFRGGPAYYITKGLNAKWLAVLFSLALIFCFGFVYESIQANSIVQAIQMAAGLTGEETAQSWVVIKHCIGAMLVIFTAPIIFGGIRRVAKVAEMIVPIMALAYILLTLFIIFKNFALIPSILWQIVKGAFSYQAAGGGFLGGLISLAMMHGIRRGLYSNEAGQGSAPNAAAAADVKHPCSQGLIQMLGVFIDTLIVCSCTAFVILLAQNLPADTNGVQLTQIALAYHLGEWTKMFLAVLLFLFCFSTIIGNYAYVESNIQYLHTGKMFITVCRMLVLGFVYFGAVQKVSLIWDMGDLAMGIMATINLIAILLLSPYVIILYKDYIGKIKSGIKDPEFKAADYPQLKAKLYQDIW